jgi:HTH-type transcriptional regulator / antitoxin HigA
MEKLKYTIIKTRVQYNEYCNKLEALVTDQRTSESKQNEIELLTLLIEKYDAENTAFDRVEPIRLLLSFMDDHAWKAKDLADLLEVSKGYVSDILNYKKGLSKEVIRKLAERFKVNQAAFNRPYKLKLEGSQRYKKTTTREAKRDIIKA